MTTLDDELSAAEVERYSRHLLLPQVGLQGQNRLKAASVLIIGAGGLGSPAALYLAAAGVGRIGIVDDDLVELSNLQRQLLHSTANLGQPKTASASSHLKSLNPEVSIDGHQFRLTSQNALELFANYDLIIDGTDNLPTRYLISDACEIKGKPWVYGSIYRFEGQVSVFNLDGGPNYRDLFPNPPPPELVPSCADGGVLGVLPGVIGALQATEALKMLLKLGQSLSGRLLVYDAQQMSFRTLQIEVGERREPVTELIDYEGFCAAASRTETESEVDSDSDLDSMSTVRTEKRRHAVQQIKPAEVVQRTDSGWSVHVVDVRSEQEHRLTRLEFTNVLIPMQQLQQRLAELPTDCDILLYCRTGVRSHDAARFLAKQGLDPAKLYNLKGGIMRWRKEIDPSIPRY